ncbi:MAG: S-layer homology domain-containing protein [Clostridiales bacterium]|nr:S-layer homology domain-containing protein [Clostridiales bacterium]
MKKLFILLTLMTAMTLSAAAFSDISDYETNRAAASLCSLGIVEGTSADQFSPNECVTRAQFCKMAVLSMGDNDYQNYKNYSLFPDVPYSFWGSAYVNAAVKKHALLRGFPDGNFLPQKQISYAQAVTVMLNMLGYKTQDVGALWPQDYISKAEDLGLLDGISSLSSDAPVTRGQAAVLIRNTLLTKTKEGAALLNKSFNEVTDEVILLGTAQNDSSIKANNARFYIDSKKILKIIKHSLPSPLIGTSGYLVMESNDTNIVKGFISDSSKSIRATVTRSYPDKIETQTGNFEIPSDAKVIISGDISDYDKGWFDISKDASINLFYDSDGDISLISVESLNISGTCFIYGISSANQLPVGAKIIKNGLPAKVSDVKRFDVVTFNSLNDTYYVSDKKISGVYQKASPSFSYPSSVTVLTKEFTVSKNASKYFGNLSYNQNITLLFDINMNVAAAYPSLQIQADQIGVLDSLDSNTAKVTLLSGVHLEAAADFTTYGSGIFNGTAVSNLYKLEGKLVKVTQLQNGKLTFSSVTDGSNVYGDWDIYAGKMGNTDVLAGVRVFEQVDPNAPLIEISAADIPCYTVKSSNIRQVFTDYAGRVSVIVVSDVSGNGYEYGILSADEEVVQLPEDKTRTYYSVHLQQSDETKTYYSKTADAITGEPGAVAKGMENLQYYLKLPYKKLISQGTVGLDKFDGSRGVTVSGGFLKIDDEVQVFATNLKQYVTLSEAKANFKNFQIFTDYEIMEGGKVRIIIAS